MGKKLIEGGKFAGLLAFAIIFSNFPGRFAVGNHETQYGRNAFEYVIAGLSEDIHEIFPVFGILFLIVWVLAQLFVGPARRGLLLQLFYSACFLFILFFSVIVSEFKIQRGGYPSPFDFFAGGNDYSFALSTLPMFYLDRYFWSMISCAIIFSVFVIRYAREDASETDVLGFSKLSGFILASILIIVAAFQIFVHSPKMFSTIHSRNELSWAGDFLVMPRLGAGKSINFILGEISFSIDEKERGGRLLGFNAERVREMVEQEKHPDCGSHPISHPLLDVKKDKTALKGSGQNPLETALTNISEELFEKNNGPIRIWHFLLESFRADDVNAINPLALREVAPFINLIYEVGNDEKSNAIVSYNMFQAGARTSQGLSAAMCGMGGMPFNLSLSRDFGNLPLRCLPDVLADASFLTRTFYGSSLSFDKMSRFFGYHGFETYEENQFPEDSPRGGWGISDMAVLEKVRQVSFKKNMENTFQYNLVITLSNHGPYSPPSDLPENVRLRVLNAIERGGLSIGSDDIMRLVTVAYTDYALEKFVRDIPKNDDGGLDIVIASGDHTSGDRFIWSEGKVLGKRYFSAAGSRIPFFVMFPNGFKGVEDHLEKLYDSIAKVNSMLKTAPISQNDIPKILMTILSSSKRFKEIDEQWRWSSVGGQALSSDFMVPGRPEVSVWGINTFSRLFFVDRNGVFLDYEEEVDPTYIDELGQVKTNMGKDDIFKRNPAIAPISAFLSSFIKGHGKACWETKNIRSAKN